MTDSRRKGRAAEQEIARLLREHLAVEITRNWQAQSAVGGADLIGLPGIAIEVKRHASPTLADRARWWVQAVEQARPGELPVLAYRGDRQPWRFTLSGDPAHRWELTHDVGLDVLIEMVRARSAA